mgnify:CR=1 FL=1
MSDSYLITANSVEFKNPFGEQNIKLYHSASDGTDQYKLIFGSICQFSRMTNVTSVNFAGFVIEKHHNRNELTISHKGNILFSIAPPE